MKALASFDNYSLYRLNRVGNIVLRVVSTTSSKSADHDKIELRSGAEIKSRAICEEDIISISEKFSEYGPSQAFVVEVGNKASLNPEEVLHLTTTTKATHQQVIN